eukprot:sb/3477816/
MSKRYPQSIWCRRPHLSALSLKWGMAESQHHNDNNPVPSLYYTAENLIKLFYLAMTISLYPNYATQKQPIGQLIDSDNDDSVPLFLRYANNQGEVRRRCQDDPHT